MGTNAATATTILLVAADPALVRLLTDLLRTARYTVAHQTLGRVALACLLCAPPGLLVLDRSLPDIDGIQTCRLARQHLPDLPIIILTACTDTEDVVQALDAGADDCIRMPVDAEILLARIAALLRGRRRHPGRI